MKKIMMMAMFAMATCFGMEAKNNSYVYSTNNEIEWKFEYQYDDENRVTSKIAYVFNVHTGDWTPAFVYTVHYGEEQNTVTFAAWNEKSKAFNHNASQATYDAKDFPVVIASPKK